MRAGPLPALNAEGQAKEHALSQALTENGLDRTLFATAPRNNFHYVLPAAALLSTLPVAALFFCFQRYFVQDANAGAVKE
ncbi:hypothetical protein [Streptomyces sp. NPDC010273]|uniref:hypothetical protein n=1 Tax=Streptomyces sp. NPDC010273 TaxID=3364829 RepID=UPI0036DFE257